MSTQAARSILFTHTSPQQGFRLLELPSELADLLSSNDAPTLELKSPSSRLAGPEESREYVNLCTPTKTYRIRQVQSSNPLHILRPSDGNSDEDNETDPVESVTSIATCGSTLELHTPAEGFSAVPILEKLLRVYDEAETEVSEAGGRPTDTERTIQRLFSDVPVYRAQCDRGWVELCAFVSGYGDALDCCWRPSAGAKLRVWMRVLEGAALQGIRLDRQFLVSDLWKSVLDDGEEEPFPRPLFEAIIRRVCGSGDGPGEEFPGGDMKWASIDKANCTRWVGETYLEAVAPTLESAIGRSEFLNAWKDHLPETWRDEVALSKLTEGSYKHPDQTTICFVNNIDRQKIKKNISASDATAAKKTRNWHELFKNQKRQKN